MRRHWHGATPFAFTMRRPESGTPNFSQTRRRANGGNEGDCVRAAGQEHRETARKLVTGVIKVTLWSHLPCTESRIRAAARLSTGDINMRVDGTKTPGRRHVFGQRKSLTSENLRAYRAPPSMPASSQVQGFGEPASRHHCHGAGHGAMQNRGTRRALPRGCARFVISREGTSDVQFRRENHRSHRWRDDKHSSHWRRDDYVSKSIDRGSITCRGGCSERCHRLPVGLHEMRQGRRNLFVLGLALGGVRQIRVFCLRDPDRSHHLPGLIVPFHQCWKSALLLVRPHRVFEF